MDAPASGSNNLNGAIPKLGNGDGILNGGVEVPQIS